jgi:hypothetical protein
VQVANDCAQAGGFGSQSGYSLQANSRVVLTDVTVTDKKGNPVHGLKASDFRISGGVSDDDCRREIHDRLWRGHHRVQ